MVKVDFGYLSGVKAVFKEIAFTFESDKP